MTPQEMKNSILQLAIQGKLVEQRSEEGTAKELYQKILEEKRHFITAGTIKRKKGNSGDIKEDEILFDIPDSWLWVRFGSIVINRDSERIPLSTAERSKLDKIYDYYGASGVIDKVDRYLFDKKLLLIGEDGANLLARSTPIAYLAEGKYWVNNHAHVLDCNENLLCLEYIMYFINAISLAKYVTGTAQPKMNQEKMNSIPIALPPLAEQKRIVAKIEELLPYIDRYERAWSRLEAFNKRFPDDMKKSILQLAIQGKLAEQKKDDLPVDLTGIKPKRTDDYEFEVPENWKLSHLETITKGIPSKQYQILESEVQQSGKFPVISQSKAYSIGFTDKREKVYHHENPVVIFGDHTTEVKYVEFDFVVGADGVKIFEPVYKIANAKFLFYVLQFYSKDLSKIGGYSRHYKFIKNKPIPLPPLAEQRRIVAKLEELLLLCERLKSES